MMRLTALLTLAVFASLARAVAPLTGVHAHNDYEHSRPLLDALEQGFCSIEADVWLVDGQLLVAHDLKNARPARTLEALYLDPLRERIRANGGRVYRGGPTVTLLVDVKSAAAPTYAALHVVLTRYAAMLTTYRDARSEPGAVAVVISGNRARAEIAAQAVRYAAIDGRPEDLDTSAPAALVPWISANWNLVFPWRWTGPMPDDTRTQLRAFVARVHAQGRLLRFWNTPDRPEAWRELRAAGVDLIGTDNLAGLAEFARP
ncbi:MAG: hypothetical protein HZA93_13475 [Verrucomicrobia bacterium]|nr:hypothetical protein [Verrucomicrobiota bacterium]